MIGRSGFNSNAWCVTARPKREAYAGAVVLFGGGTAANFQNGVLSKDGNLMSECTTRQSFNGFHLHLEFRLSYMPSARGQCRSNSSVCLHNSWEVQVLDSFGLDGESHDCGAPLRAASSRRQHVFSAADVADL